MARQTLTSNFWEVPITSGTLQNVGLVDIEINNAQNDDTGIVLEPSEIYQWDSATVFVRKANNNNAPCEVAYVPFKRATGGGGGSYTLPVASASTLGGIKVGSGLSIDGDGVLTGASTYTLPTATASTLGGVKSSLDTGNIKVNADGTMTINGVQVMGYDEVAGMAAPSSIYITLPTDGTAFDISAGDFIEVMFTSSSSNNSIYVALRKDAQSSWSNQYLFQHKIADWETRQVVLLDGFSEGKLVCQGNMSGIAAVGYRYSIGHAKALGLI